MLKVRMPPACGHGAEFYAYFLRSGFYQTKGIDFKEDKALLAMVHGAPGFEGKGVIPIQIEDEDRMMRAWYDFADFPHVIHPEVMAKDDIYLKMNLTYEDAGRPDFYPIGIACGPHLMDGLAEYRAIRASGIRLYAAIALLRSTAYEIRCKAVAATKAVKAPKGKTILAGVSGRSNRPEVPQALWGPKLTAVQYCQAIARADLNVTAPGIGPWTWRHTETFGIGTALIAPPLTVAVAFPLTGAFIEVAPDFSNATAIMQEWLERPADRKTVEEAGRDYYEHHLKPEAIAAYILKLAREHIELQGRIGPADPNRKCPECGSPLFEKQACCWWKKHGWLTILRCSAVSTCDFMEGLKMGEEIPRGEGGGDAGQI